MPKIDISKVKWDAPASGINVDNVVWDQPSTPVVQQSPPVQKKPEGGILSTLKELAAPYASALDTTVGGVIPAVVGQVAYPAVRAFSTPEQAQQVTAGITGAIDRPFGKALGVTELPEYQGEATRRISGAVGNVVQSGVNRVASATGLPASDVSSIAGSAALMVPGAARAGVNALREMPAVQAAEGAARESINKLREPARQKASEAAYARGAQIDAAKEAQRLGIAIDPRDLNPESRTAKVRTMMAGERGVPEIQKANVGNVRQVMLDDLNLPKEADLTKPETFDKARAALSKPYDEIARLPTVVADADTLERIQKLMPEGHIIGKEAREAAIGRVVESADRLMTEGLTGRQILDNISNLRKEARKVYDAKSPDLAALEAADTKLAIANILEGVVEKNIPDSGLLKEFRAARAGMARTYAYEGAVNKNTSMLEVDRLARITSKDNSYTGRIASLGQIAGNFPYAFTDNPALGGSTLSSNNLGRGSLGGSAASSLAYMKGGYQAAVPFSIVGGVADMLGRGMSARKMASREYQAKQFIPDARIRKIEPDTPQNLGPTVARGREIVPYVMQDPEVVGPAQPDTTYRPNWVPGRNGPTVRTVRPDVPTNALPAPSAEGTMNTLRREDVRRAAMSREIGREAEARMAAAEAARPRAPASREVILDFDPVTGRFRTGSQGVKGATPEIVRDTGVSLNSAVEKLIGRQGFTLSAEEKIAWDKTRAGLSELAGVPKISADKLADANVKTVRVQNDLDSARAELSSLARDRMSSVRAETKAQIDARVSRVQTRIASLNQEYKSLRQTIAENELNKATLSKLTDKQIAGKMADREWVEGAITKARQKEAMFADIAARAKTEREHQAALIQREKMQDLLNDLEEKIRAPRVVVGQGQGPKTRAHQKNALAEARSRNALR